MHLEIHTPYFGVSTVEGKPIECPACPRGLSLGANDWKDRTIETCSPGETFECNRCGTVVIINWGLLEPDHLSHSKSFETCTHRLCMLLAEKLRAAA